MNNPTVAIHDGNMLVSQKTKTLCVSIRKEGDNHQQLAGHFLEDGKSTHATVLAPAIEHELLAHRIVSYLSAYMPVMDYKILEDEILRNMSSCLRSYHPY